LAVSVAMSAPMIVAPCLVLRFRLLATRAGEDGGVRGMCVGWYAGAAEIWVSPRVAHRVLGVAVETYVVGRPVALIRCSKEFRNDLQP
jgi:hypothetical protein